MRSLAFIFVAFNSLVFNGCDSFYFDSEKIQSNFEAGYSNPQKKEMTVLTTSSGVSFNKNDLKVMGGIDHDLLTRFRQTYDLKIKFKVLKNEEAVLSALEQGKGDLATGRFQVATLKQHPELLLGPSIEESQLAIFCRQQKNVKSLKDLKGQTVLVQEQVATTQVVTQLQKNLNLKLSFIKSENSADLFKKLLKGKVDCVLSDNWQGLIRLKSHLKFTRIHVFEEKYSINWMLNSKGKALNDLLHVWAREAARNDVVLTVLDKNRAPFLALDKLDLSSFSKKKNSLLPKYKDVFRNAGMLFDLPWELLAAISFQESQWNPEAVSFTGVKGLMQITKDTEKFLGLRSRQDPIESIWGGAKYVKYIYDQIGAQTNNEDRLSLTLAAYNMGLGHLRDAQKLVEQRGKNPDSWRDIKQVLPLLANAETNSGLQYGAARGNETLIYVERVRGFLYYLQN